MLPDMMETLRPVRSWHLSLGDVEESFLTPDFLLLSFFFQLQGPRPQPAFISTRAGASAAFPEVFGGKCQTSSDGSDLIRGESFRVMRVDVRSDDP